MLVLRGVPGSGKSQVALILKRCLGDNAIVLNLDKYAPDNERIRFDSMISEAIGFNYVICELYSGRAHTSDPASWVDKFRDQYKIQSFVLNISLDCGFRNCLDLRHSSYRPSNREEYESVYNRFYKWQQENLFATRAGIGNETIIDAEDCEWSRVAKVVLKEAGLNQLSTDGFSSKDSNQSTN